MKLLNKLIPVASSALIPAIVTPLATSCSQVSNSITYNFKFERKSIESEPTVPFNTYITQYEPAEQLFDDKGIDEDTAWQLYFDKLESDPRVFCDDFIYNACEKWMFGGSIWSNFLSFDGHLKVTLTSFDRETKRFSWVVEFLSNSVFMSLSGKVNDFVEQKIVFDNFPCALTDQNDDGKWELAPNEDWEFLSTDEEYSIELYLKANTSDQIIDEVNYINHTNSSLTRRFYYMEDNYGIAELDTADIVYFANFGFTTGPNWTRPALHYLQNNPVKK